MEGRGEGEMSKMLMISSVWSNYSPNAWKAGTRKSPAKERSDLKRGAAAAATSLQVQGMWGTGFASRGAPSRRQSRSRRCSGRREFRQIEGSIEM